VRDQNEGEGDDEQVVREPEIGKRIQRSTDPGPAEASGALGPPRREGVSHRDEQDEDPAGDEGARRRDVAQRQRPWRPEPDLFFSGPPRPGQGRGRHEHAVERASCGADDGEPDVVFDGAVEVEEAAEGRRSVFCL